MGKTSLDLSILFRKQDFCALPKTKTGVSKYLHMPPGTNTYVRLYI
jgi:hypothetical protein